jgi:hypothetical protein
VVLPQPEGPTIDTISPATTANVTLAITGFSAAYAYSSASTDSMLG